MKTFLIIILSATMVIPAMITYAQSPQYYFYYDNEPPSEGAPLARHHIVTPGGKIELNAFDFYSWGKENLEGMLADVPTNFSAVNFSLKWEYMSPAMDEYIDEIYWPMTGLGIYSGTFPKGYYRNIQWAFKWKDNNIDKSVLVNSKAKLVIPNVARIPVYVYAGALNRTLFFLEDPIRDMMELRRLFKEMGGRVSSLLTGLRAIK